MMGNIFDKLGLYDFWGTFVPGFIGIVVFRLVSFHLGGGGGIEVFFNDIIFYIVCSYVLGLILHEIGHFLQDRIIYHRAPFPIIRIPKSGGEPVDVFFKDNNKILSPKEKELYNKLFMDWKNQNDFGTDSSCETVRMFFNYCNYYIEKNRTDSKAAKMQSLYGMSRSLFTFFGILTIMLYPYSLYHQSTDHVLCWIFLSIALTILFYFRMKRFNIIRLKVVMRTYATTKAK